MAEHADLGARNERRICNFYTKLSLSIAGSHGNGCSITYRRSVLP